MSRLSGTDTVVFSCMTEEPYSRESATFLQSILALGVTASKKMKLDVSMCPKGGQSTEPSSEQTNEYLRIKKVSNLYAVMDVD